LQVGAGGGEPEHETEYPQVPSAFALQDTTGVELSRQEGFGGVMFEHPFVQSVWA
jgi:hypothetical protein